MSQRIIAPGDGWYALRVIPQSLAYSKRMRTHYANSVRLDATEYVFPAEEAFEQCGLNPFVPTEGSWRRRSRYYRQKDRQRVRKPLLTGYILIDPPEPVRWDLIMKMPIVIGVITNHLGDPVRIPKIEPRRVNSDGEIITTPRASPISLSAVMARHRTNARAEEEFMPTGRTFAAGDAVEMLNDEKEAFAGLHLVVREIGRETTRVLAFMMGGEMEIEVATWKLASVRV